MPSQTPASKRWALFSQLVASVLAFGLASWAHCCQRQQAVDRVGLLGIAGLECANGEASETLIVE